MEEQNTILNEQYFFGNVDNRIVNVALRQNNTPTGIIFKRIDMDKNNLIELNINNVSIENNELVLKNSSGLCIKNIEVLLASIWASKIDNLIIEVDYEEIPYIKYGCESLLFLLVIGKRKPLEQQFRKILNIYSETKTIDDSFFSILPNKDTVITIQNESEEFVFDNAVMPFKDWLSKIDKDETNIRYNIISTIAMLAVFGMNYNYNFIIKNFKKSNVLSFLKNYFNNI